MPLGGDRPLAAFGEIGLTGELRPVAHHERRVSEAEKFGLEPVLAPGDGRHDAPPGAHGARSPHRPVRAESGRERESRAHSEPNTAGKSRTPSAVQWSWVQHAGDEVSELENRQEPRLVRALEMVAPGTAVREGIDASSRLGLGALICIGDDAELSFLYSGGIKLDIDYTPAVLYQLAKMDGAIVLNANATKISLGERPADAGPDDPLARDRHPAPHRRTRLASRRTHS